MPNNRMPSPPSFLFSQELLIATRHVLATDFRTSFIPYIEVLLQEDVLIGTGTTSFETLRLVVCAFLFAWVGSCAKRESRMTSLTHTADRLRTKTLAIHSNA